MNDIEIQSSDHCRLQWVANRNQENTPAYKGLFVCWVRLWRDVPVAFENFEDAYGLYSALKSKPPFVEYTPVRVNEGSNVAIRSVGTVTIGDEVYQVLDYEGSNFPRLYTTGDRFHRYGIDIEGKGSLFPGHLLPNTMPVELRLCTIRNRIKTLQSRVDDAKREYYYQVGCLGAAKLELAEIEDEYLTN
jgi:hypothetical protein